jgi:ribosomal protein L34E
MKTGSMPCRRCHRLKHTDSTRCCTYCNEALRALEKRRPAQVEAIDLSRTDPPPALPKNALTFIEPNLERADVSSEF